MKESEVYLSRHGCQVPYDSDPWLERWRDLLETAGQGRILELGCGGGRDTRYLTDLGFQVVASDYSDQALALCRERVPLAELHKIDLRGPLPFPDRTFPVVLASLCLQFFRWSSTVAMLEEIRRCLKPGGFLLARVNSLRDLHGSVSEHEEVEPHLFLVDGRLKRFFERPDVERLAGPGWRLLGLEEMAVRRYASTKYLWEFVLEKSSDVQTEQTDLDKQGLGAV